MVTKEPGISAFTGGDLCDGFPSPRAGYHTQAVSQSLGATALSFGAIIAKVRPLELIRTPFTRAATPPDVNSPQHA